MGSKNRGRPDLICDCRSSLWQPEGQGWVDPWPYAGISEHPCLVKAARTEPTHASPTCLSSSAHLVLPVSFRATMLSRLTPLPPEQTPKRGGHPISSSVGWRGTRRGKFSWGSWGDDGDGLGVVGVMTSDGTQRREGGLQTWQSPEIGLQVRRG